MSLSDKLALEGWRVSPATVATHLTAVEQHPQVYLPYRHLTYLSKIIRRTVARGGRTIISMPPQHGKPVDVNALVSMGYGGKKRLGDVHVGDTVITNEGHPRKVLKVYEQGLLPAVKIRTECGREVTAALDHPFLTPDGWKEAKDLRSGPYLGDTLLSPVSWKLDEYSNITPEDAALMGYFVGDGNCTRSENGKLQSKITVSDELQSADIDRCSKKLGFVSLRCGEKPTFWVMNISGGSRSWLELHGLAGKGSYTKRVPESVLQSSDACISAFLGAYFACDGSINAKGKVRKDSVAEFYSVSKLLLQDTQTLLLRLGIQSRLSPKNGLYKGEIHKSWRLIITGRENISRFTDRVPVQHSRKSALLKEWRAPRTRCDEKYLGDRIASIEPTQAECRCLEVEEDHTFLVEDLIVHNSVSVSKWTPLWFLENWPKKRVILCGYGQNFARDWGRAVRDTIDRYSDQLTVRISESAAQADRWDTMEGGGMLCAGVGGGITGKPANLLIIDDPIKGYAEAASHVTREMIWNWYVTEARTRIHKGTAVILVSTRWHEDDLAARLVKHSKPGTWEIVNLPAIYDELAAASGPCPLGRSIGEPLCPELHDLDDLHEQMLNSQEAWDALYQGRPGSTAGKGNVYKSFSKQVHVRNCNYDPNERLIWSTDFNVNPMASVIAQYNRASSLSIYEYEREAKVRILDELVLPDSNTEESAKEMVERVLEMIGPYHRTELEIYGDPAGSSRHSSQVAGSDYKIIMDVIRNRARGQIIPKLMVAKSAPAIKDRVNAVNRMFKTADEMIRMYVDHRCQSLTKDFENVSWKKDVNGNTTGQLDKSGNLTHVSDALGYFIEKKFGSKAATKKQRTDFILQ